jgi:hypothetical protein
MDRFWNRVDSSGGPDACWPWLGCIFKNAGYGCVSFKKKLVGTHRVAWSLVNGDIPAGMWICHRCDNRICCNPAHLFLGTPRDNVLDMIAKGRGVPPAGDGHWMRKNAGAQAGDSNFNAKLTADDVEQIKRWLVAGMKTTAIARVFNVSGPTISLIASGTNWAAVPWPEGAHTPLDSERAVKARGKRAKMRALTGGVCAKDGCDGATVGGRTLCDPCWVVQRKKSKTERARIVRDEAWKARAA